MKRKDMTKDDPSAEVTSPQTMEQNIAMLKLNLNEPLTDQLAKHAFVQEEREWRDGVTKIKRQTEYDCKPTVYGEDGKRIDYDASEAVDSVVRKNSSEAVPLNTDASKHGFHGSKMDLYSFVGTAHENHGKHQVNGHEKPIRTTSNHINGSKGDDFKDQKKSDQHMIHNTERSKHSSVDFAAKLEATGRGPGPPPPAKKSGDEGGKQGAKPKSAFLPVDRQPRDFVSSIPGVYKAPVYPFCVLPYPASHPLLQSPASDPRLLAKIQSPNVGNQLSPFILYSDPNMTHQLEVLWQQKYPHLPVPPVWMLHQYTDELLRDTGHLPPPAAAAAVDRTSGRELFSVSSAVNSVPINPGPIDAVSVDRKRDKKDVQDRNSVAMETKRAEGQSRVDSQTRRKNDCKERKDQQIYDSEPQTQEKTKSSCDWYKLCQRRSEFLPGNQVHQRMELLVDQSAASACDAVDQHFQESLLRLNSQNHMDIPRIGRDIQSGICEDRSTEKSGIYGNSNYQNWNDVKCATGDAKNRSNTFYDQNRSSGFKPTSHLASRTQKSQSSQISFDIYGYQHQQRPVESPGKLSDVAIKGSFSSKLDKSGFKNGHREQCVPYFSYKNSSQENHQRPESGYPAANPKMEVKDSRQDGWNLHNVLSKIPDKQFSIACPTKRINEVKFSVGSHSVASPTPGSAVKDSRVGPSRLIAGSPRPLPSIFYNPLDPRMELVQPYQVSIEPSERWSGNSPWTQCPSDWPMSQAVHNSATSNGMQQRRTVNSIPPGTQVSIPHSLIPTPVRDSVVRVGGQHGYKVGMPDQNQVITSTSCVAVGTESLKTSSKRFVAREDDSAPECLKRPKVNSVGHRSEGSPLVSIDSFKSFVDQAVYNAFREDSDRRVEPQKVSDMLLITKTFDPTGAMEPNRQQQIASDCRLRGSSAFQSSDVCRSTTAIMSPTPSIHSPTASDKKSNEVKTITSSSKNCSQVEPYSDTLSTLSSDTSASDEQRVEVSCSASSVILTSSVHPPPLSSPPSPRAAGASLNLKKAWLLRYSDINRKSPSDMSASGFPDAEADGVLDYTKHGFADKSSGSVGISKFLPLGETSENPTGSALEPAVDKTKDSTLSTSVLNIPKRQSDRSVDSDSSSETSFDSNISKTQNSRGSKRNLPSELPSRCPKMTKTVSSWKNSGTDSQNCRRIRGKNSKILDDGITEVASDSEVKSSQLRRKTRVRAARNLDPKDENLGMNEQHRKTSDVFLQDGSCLKVAQRLPKCRDCKTQRSNRNSSQTGNICKFDVFRKLSYNSKGVLSVAGFLEPSDIKTDDIDLWMPSKSTQTSLTLVQAQYLMTHLKDFFTHLLRRDTSLKFLEPSEDKSDKSLLWRRPMERVQETCDTCDTVVFDIHWTCKKCGFVVCSDCHSRRTALNDAEDEDDETDWPLCSTKRQSHDPEDLALTQIIPKDALSALNQKFIQSIDKSKSVVKTVDNGLNGKFSGEMKTEEDENRPTLNTDHDRVSEDLACATKPSSSISEETDSKILTTSSKLSPDGINNERDGNDLGSFKEEKVKVKFDADAMSSLDFHGQLTINTTDDEEALRLFQRRWCRLMPVVVHNRDKVFSSGLWKPETFLKRFSHLRLDLVSCLNGTVHRFQPLEKLWNGSKNSSSTRNLGLLQFKDWPLAEDWAGALGDHCADLNRILPVSSYTLSNGTFNLASHLPEFFHQPELATRINVGYANLAQGHVTCVKMQTNTIDFVNVVMSAESRGLNDGSECDAGYVTRLLKECDYDVSASPLTENLEKIVAIWHIYHPKDSSKIQTVLEKIMSRKSGGQNCSLPSDAGGYFDAELRDRLRHEVGVQATVAVQCLGDAVFVPATAFYQIKVIQECVSVTKEFISPESVASFFAESSDWNHLNNTEQENLQIKNLVYHAMKDCIGILDESDS